jgi:hypothetical protein
MTATFEITKTGIISPKAGEKMYRIFTREHQKEVSEVSSSGNE